MKQLLKNTLTAGLIISMSFAASAKLTTEKLFENLRVQPLSEFAFEEVQNLNLKTYYTTGGIVHIDEAKQIVIAQGQLLKIENEKLVDLQVESNRIMLEKLEDKIVYKSPNEKYKIQVFSDISCPACQGLHQRLDNYLNAGITVEIILFSRNGPEAAPFLQMSSFSERANQKQALNDAMTGGYVFSAAEPSAQMVAHQSMAMSLAINSTPTMFYKGYNLSHQKADTLLQIFNTIEEQEKTVK